jgi:hypothetical protein
MRLFGYLIKHFKEHLESNSSHKRTNVIFTNESINAV